MSRPNEIDDKFAKIILAIEESIFELEDLLDLNNSFSEKENEDLITAKELAQSARDLVVTVIASNCGKKPPPKF